jgi:hypothetical protein
MFIPDPIFPVTDPGLSADKIPDPVPHPRIPHPFVTQKTDTKFSKIRSRLFIPDLGFKKPPDPGSGTLQEPAYTMLNILYTLILQYQYSI